MPLTALDADSLDVVMPLSVRGAGRAGMRHLTAGNPASSLVMW